MAKELPYYRFYVDEYLSGDITFEDYATQGVFKLACCYYWKSDCKMTLQKLNKRLTGAEQMLNNLIKSNIIKHNVQTDEIKINFLFEQFNPLISISEKRSNAGKQSGAKRRAMKQELNKCSTSDEQMTIYKDKDKDKDKDKLGDTKKKKCLFKNSEYFNNIPLIEEKIGEKYLKYNIVFYYESVLNWSDSKNSFASDWLATIRNFILRDVREGKGQLKNKIKKSEDKY